MNEDINRSALVFAMVVFSCMMVILVILALIIKFFE